MSALTKPFENYERPGLVVSYKVAASTKIFKGALVAVNSDGYAIPLDPALVSLKFIGVAAETVDNSVGTPGAKSINVTKAGSFVFKAGDTPAQTGVGSVAYGASDWECVVSSGSLSHSYVAGTVVAIENTSTGAAGYRIRIDSSTL